jgi:hypothetical protein
MGGRSCAAHKHRLRSLSATRLTLTRIRAAMSPYMKRSTLHADRSTERNSKSAFPKIAPNRSLACDAELKRISDRLRGKRCFCGGPLCLGIRLRQRCAFLVFALMFPCLSLLFGVATTFPVADGWICGWDTCWWACGVLSSIVSGASRLIWCL